MTTTPSWMARSGRFAARGVIYLIELYRNMVSPLRLPTCRFTPTCSQYAVEALTEFGLVRGAWLSCVRLLKCGPWHRGGWDPIPERESAGSTEPARQSDPGYYNAHRVIEATDFDRDNPAERGECKSSV